MQDLEQSFLLKIHAINGGNVLNGIFRNRLPVNDGTVSRHNVAAKFFNHLSSVGLSRILTGTGVRPIPDVTNIPDVLGSRPDASNRGVGVPDGALPIMPTQRKE